MHVACFTVKRFVLKACGRLSGRGGGGQLALDPGPGVGLNGAYPRPRLHHGLVFRTCRVKTLFGFNFC